MIGLLKALNGLTRMPKLLPIFLVAGMGTRLNHPKPKCLIEVENRSLIYRSILALKQLHIEEVVMIVGHEKKLIINEIGNEISNIKVHYIENKEFHKTGTAFSLYCAKDLALKKKLDILMLHGDILYDPKIFSLNIDSEKSSIFVDSSFETKTNDEMVVFLKNGLIKSIIKGPESVFLKKHQNDVAGESLGINYFIAKDLEDIFENLKKSINNNRKIHWEQTIEALVVEKKIKLNILDIAPLNWINVNYDEDLYQGREFSFIQQDY